MTAERHHAHGQTAVTSHLVRLTARDREIVQAIRRHAEQWLAGRGIEQYSGANAAQARQDLDHGFEHVRTVERPGRMSGALFERRL